MTGGRLTYPPPLPPRPLLLIKPLLLYRLVRAGSSSQPRVPLPPPLLHHRPAHDPPLQPLLIPGLLNPYLGVLPPRHAVLLPPRLPSRLPPLLPLDLLLLLVSYPLLLLPPLFPLVLRERIRGDPAASRATPPPLPLIPGFAPVPRPAAVLIVAVRARSPGRLRGGSSSLSSRFSVGVAFSCPLSCPISLAAPLRVPVPLPLAIAFSFPRSVPRPAPRALAVAVSSCARRPRVVAWRHGALHQQNKRRVPSAEYQLAGVVSARAAGLGVAEPLFP